jgi:hypothetical protein
VARVKAKLRQLVDPALKPVKFWYSVGVELRKLWTEVQEKFGVPM